MRKQHYISTNYTHASSYLLTRGLNVVTQLVAKRGVDGVTRYSLSCNTDITLDILQARATGRATFRLIGQVNSELPFMPGDGDLPADEFSARSRQPRDGVSRCLRRRPSRSATPNTRSGFMWRASCRDGGTLQIGIGQVGDALAQALILRHRDSAQFTRHRLEAPCARRASPLEQRAPFTQGALRRQRDADRGVSRH